MPNTTKRKSYRHGNVLQAAIDASVNHVRTLGHTGLTVRRVAQDIGVDHRALYRHIDDKSALLGMVATVGYRLLADRLEAPIDHNPVSQFANAFERYLEFAFEEPHLYRLMFSQDHKGTEAHQNLEIEVRRVTSVAYKALCQTLKVGAGPAEEDAERYRDTIVTVWAAAHGMLNLNDVGLLANSGTSTVRTKISGRVSTLIDYYLRQLNQNNG